MGEGSIFEVAPSACLHLLFLSSFVLVFFWVEISKSYKSSSQMGASNTSAMLTSAVNLMCTSPDSKVENTTEIREKVVPYLDQWEKYGESRASPSNYVLQWITYGITIGLFLLFIVFCRVAHKKKTMTGKWGNLFLYNIFVFILFCAFEVGFYLEIIQKYQPMSQAEHAHLFATQLKNQVNKLRKGTITLPKGTEKGPMPEGMPQPAITLIRESITRMSPDSPLLAYIRNM